LNIVVNPGFGISASPTALALGGASSQATSVLLVTPGGDPRTLTFACSGLSAAYSCIFSPPNLPLSGLSAQQQVTMTVAGLSAVYKTDRYSSRQTSSMALSKMGLNIITSFVLGLFVPFRRRRFRQILVALITLFLATGFIACSKTSSTSTTQPPSSNSYGFQVNVMAGGNTVRTLNYTLTVQ
jgi:hypothetical protein